MVITELIFINLTSLILPLLIHIAHVGILDASVIAETIPLALFIATAVILGVATASQTELMTSGAKH